MEKYVNVDPTRKIQAVNCQYFMQLGIPIEEYLGYRILHVHIRDWDKYHLKLLTKVQNSRPEPLSAAWARFL